MSVRIRLSRTGKKDKPSYRIVAIDKKEKRDGKVLETLGYYDPTFNPSKISVDKKKLDSWISKGAIVSSSVQKIIKL